ncbi:MAG: hypothetical protein HY042_11570, partial [Spirochaetia bacterium]|nr:hypothetical protein [Spirochaetia bacterium]
MIIRPRRNRRSEAIRTLVRETNVTPGDLIVPLFVKEGRDSREPIPSMPGIFRHSLDLLTTEAKTLYGLGVPAVALFPALPDSKKDHTATESWNESGLVQETIKALKDAVPELCVITDVAMDPYSSDGHDGLVNEADGETEEDGFPSQRGAGLRCVLARRLARLFVGA